MNLAMPLRARLASCPHPQSTSAESIAPNLRFRQIHLDFHTSEFIPNIGSHFDPLAFAHTLADAHVDSVTCFARCHHGWLYYPSQKFPELIHPQLKRPRLLIEQIEACHQLGIRVPIYVTVQWDALSARLHPEWLCDGFVSARPSGPLDPGFYRFLDVFHPGYRAFLRDQVAEIFDLMPVDGLFFDIVNPAWSLAPHWLAEMDRRGFKPELLADRQLCAQQLIGEWKMEMSAFISELQPDCSVFYNSGHIGPRHRPYASAFSHWEIESLPSGGWGYMHFPITMRYARTIKPCLGMTGKFHTAWGDFHSYKNQAALEFECFQMLALGAGCSVGDQLSPSGALCPATYQRIGNAYRQVAQKEPYCRDAKPLCDIAVVTPEIRSTTSAHHNLPASILGVTRILQESRHQFDIVDFGARLSDYKLLILSDDIVLDPPGVELIDGFLAEGGALLASHHSGLNPPADAFALESLGLRLIGPSPWEPDFIVPGPKLSTDVDRPYVMYQRAMQVEATPGTEILATVERPWFNRDWRHYCSHMHAPSSGEIIYPGIVRNGNCIYFAHPIFGQYAANAPLWCKQLVLSALRLLLPRPLVECPGAPSTMLVTLNRQAQHNRDILHLLHYIPERRGAAFDTIEDIIPLHDVQIIVRPERRICAVMTVPEKQPLAFEQNDQGLLLTLPLLRGHQMIALLHEPRAI